MPDLKRIRIAMEADAAAIAAIYAPYVAETAISFELEAPAPAEIAARLEKTLRTHPWLVCERSGAVMGYAYASRHRERAAYRWSADVAVYVARGARGQGIGRALYAPLLRILHRQGFYRAYAGIALPNQASVGLHEAFGFRPLGIYRAVGFKLGRWHDVGWWELELAQALAEPRPPLPFQPEMFAEPVDG